MTRASNIGDSSAGAATMGGGGNEIGVIGTDGTYSHTIEPTQPDNAKARPTSAKHAVRGKRRSDCKCLSWANQNRSKFASARPARRPHAGIVRRTRKRSVNPVFAGC